MSAPTSHGTAVQPIVATAGRGRPRLRLRDVRIRTKLALILVAPLLAITVLGGARLNASVAQARQADLLRALVGVSAAAATLAHELHTERIAAARLLADPAAASAAAPVFGAAAARTDLARDAYEARRAQLPRAPDAVAASLTTIDARLDALAPVRAAVAGADRAPVTGVVLRYSAVIHAVRGMTQTLVETADDPALAGQIRAVAALSAAKQHAADAQAAALLPGSDVTTGAILAAQAGQAQAFAAFEQAANAAQRVAARTITGAGSQPAMKLAEDRLHDLLVATATQRRDAVYRQVAIESTGTAVALAVTVATALLLASALARSLRRLRTNALAVAQHDLPAAVARLADPAALTHTTPAQLAADISTPPRLRGRDEIGQVAHAFTTVHQEAVRVAAEQASLRASVSAMFLHLARRSQTLVDKMISQLDVLQRDETDQRRLAQVFELDSLATRMRRNDENLLVLAGSDSSPPRRQDALLRDVLTAAQAEVAHYARVEFGAVDDDVSVAAHAVNDVVRLVAELLDNATHFSQGPVLCEARRLGPHLLVRVEDRGLGMRAEDVATVNTLLASPGQLDVATFRRMGIAVIALLAARHRIQVQVQSELHIGTAATVALPPGVILTAGGRHYRPSYPVTTVPGEETRRASSTVVRHTARRAQHPLPADAVTESLPAIDATSSEYWPPSVDEPWTGAFGTRGSAHEAGLPKRVPQAQNPEPAQPPAAQPPGALPAPRRPAEQTRSQLSAYQRGVQQARRRTGTQP